MPELPEVETVRRGLQPVMEGQKIARVVAHRGDLRFPLQNDFVARLTGGSGFSLAFAGFPLLICAGGGCISCWLGRCWCSKRFCALPLAEEFHLVVCPEHACRSIVEGASITPSG